VPYKKVRTIVEAFRALPGRRLVVVGDGSELRHVKAAAGTNVEILGHQPSAVLRDLMQRAKAFVFAAEEDFGIAPVEALACGTPVIAYGRGGALETVRDTGPRACGLFFHSQTPGAIAAAIQEFERRQQELAPQACRDNALRFATDIFKERYWQFVQTRWDEFRSERKPRPNAAFARVRAYG
jgi:glycosyltransferase involved in cell wall biosynthesis